MEFVWWCKAESGVTVAFYLSEMSLYDAVELQAVNCERVGNNRSQMQTEEVTVVNRSSRSSQVVEEK